MRDVILKNLAAEIDPTVLKSLLASYEKMVAERGAGGFEECLAQAGKFVEHTLRAIEFLRTGTAPAEIKKPADTVRAIEQDGSLPESLRLLIPRIAYAMIYDVRSKRGAVHVKEIDPREIDAALSVQAASWVMAELLRLFHSDDETVVTEAMAALVQLEMPFVESLGGEAVVTAKVPCAVELMLLIGRTKPKGILRQTLGTSSKNSSSTVSKALQKLKDERFVHEAADGQLHLTGPGERQLEKALIEHRVR